MQKKRVLIAEDYADVRQMMKIMVEFYGYEAIEASDGHEAVEWSGEELFPHLF